ncbi:MAG TPA: hypothetical protein VH596_14055 [Terriglobales bacterium]
MQRNQKRVLYVYTLALCLICTLLLSSCSRGQTLKPIQNASGVRLLVADAHAPTLRIVLPGLPDSDGSIEVIFPEHVTAKLHDSNEPVHLYLFRSESGDHSIAWSEDADSLKYELDLGNKIHFIAQATLEQDGILFHYEFKNDSGKAYDMIYAVTDPRLTGMFHDVRLERTYVHHKDGFDLLASETPVRLTMPLNHWLPSRYLASYTWPVPKLRIEHREDGITYYNKSRAVDEPMVATLSSDRKWVVASFSRTTGNVWSNPELTCQHVDPEIPLAAGGRAVSEVKILVFRGNLDDALEKVTAQRPGLQ